MRAVLFPFCRQPIRTAVSLVKVYTAAQPDSAARDRAARGRTCRIASHGKGSDSRRNRHGRRSACCPAGYSPDACRCRSEPARAISERGSRRLPARCASPVLVFSDSGSIRSDSFTLSASVISAAVRCRTKTGLPCHIVTMPMPSAIGARFTSIVDRASVSVGRVHAVDQRPCDRRPRRPRPSRRRPGKETPAGFARRRHGRRGWRRPLCSPKLQNHRRPRVSPQVARGPKHDRVPDDGTDIHAAPRLAKRG